MGQAYLMLHWDRKYVLQYFCDRTLGITVDKVRLLCCYVVCLLNNFSYRILSAIICCSRPNKCVWGEGGGCINTPRGGGHHRVGKQKSYYIFRV